MGDVLKFFCFLFQFETVEDAAGATKVHIIYACGPLVMHHLKVHEDLLQDVDETLVGFEPNTSSTAAGSQHISPLSARSDHLVDERATSPAGGNCVGLETTEGTFKFLLECAKCKGNNPKCIATKDLLANVAINLKSLHNVSATVEECTKLNRKLHEQFRRNRSYSRWEKELAFIRGEPGAENPFGEDALRGDGNTNTGKINKAFPLR